MSRNRLQKSINMTPSKILQKFIQMDMGIHLESSSPGWFREQHKLHIADQCIQRGMNTNRLQKSINMAPSKMLQKSIQVAHCRSVHTKRYEYKQTAEMYQHGTIKNVAKICTDGHGFPFGIIITRVVQGAA